VPGRGEVLLQLMTEEGGPARSAQTGWAACNLLGQALSRENLLEAWKRVKTN
jgi:hypothetical protein